MMAHKAFGCFMGLLECDRHEEIAVLLGQLGEAIREKETPEVSMRACLWKLTRRQLGVMPIVASRRRQIPTFRPWSSTDLEVMIPHQMDIEMRVVMGLWSSDWRMAPQR